MTKQEEGRVGKSAFTQLLPAQSQEQGELSRGPAAVSLSHLLREGPPDSRVTVLRGLLPMGGFSLCHPFLLFPVLSGML